MTQWTDARIPLWFPPVEGEALDSWLEAYSRRLLTAMPEFVRFLGLPGARLNHMVRCLTDHERQALSRRTGLSPDRLTMMTLEPWDGLAVTIDRRTRRLNRPPIGTYTGNFTRYCPRCLGESAGRWQLSWRLPWSFACTRHGVLLLDHCPECEQPPMVHGYRRLRKVPPGTCLYGTGGANAVRCGFFLPHAPSPFLPPRSLVLDAQHEVNTGILGAETIPSSARQYGQELAVLARTALRGLRTRLALAPPLVHDVLAECGGTLPEMPSHYGSSDAHNTALGISIARIALHRERDDSDAAFTWLMATLRSQRDHAYPTKWLIDWVPAGPRVTSRALAAVDKDLTWLSRLRFGTTTSAPAWPTLTDGDVHRRAARLPAMLWPSWTMRLLPSLPKPIHRLAGVRRACSTLLLMPGTNCDYLQAAGLLGNRRSLKIREALDTAIRNHGPTELATTIVLLARAVDSNPVPIDYARRRTTFSETTVAFDSDAYQDYCRRHGMRAGPVQLKRLRWHLLKLLLGADPGASSHTPAWSTELSLQITEELKLFLLRQAAENLTSHDITEPVLWQPPSTWLDKVEWPGVDPADIDSVTLSKLVATGRPLSHAAKDLEISEDHVRLHLEATGISVSLPPPPQQRAQGCRIPRQGVLAPQELQRLYQDEGISPPEIAQLAGCNPSTVRRALNEAKIPIRATPAAPCVLSAVISRDWLEQEYSRQGRSTVDIARQLGTHKDNVARQLKSWGIPRRPSGLYSNPFAALTVTLSVGMHRVSRTRNCVLRLRNLLQLPGHHNLSAAAAALGIAPGSLSYQLRSIEGTLQFTVIMRTTPLSVTSAGAAFLSEARRLIALLDNYATPSRPS